MALESTVTAEQLATRCGGKGPDGLAKATRCLDYATTELERALLNAFRVMPVVTVDECLLSIGQAVWNRTKTPGTGGGQLTIEDGATVAVARDPLASVRSILVNYVPGGFA